MLLLFDPAGNYPCKSATCTEITTAITNSTFSPLQDAGIYGSKSIDANDESPASSKYVQLAVRSLLLAKLTLHDYERQKLIRFSIADLTGVCSLPTSPILLSKILIDSRLVLQTCSQCMIPSTGKIQRNCIQYMHAPNIF